MSFASQITPPQTDTHSAEALRRPSSSFSETCSGWQLSTSSVGGLIPFESSHDNLGTQKNGKRDGVDGFGQILPYFIFYFSLLYHIYSRNISV